MTTEALTLDFTDFVQALDAAKTQALHGTRAVPMSPGVAFASAEGDPRRRLKITEDTIEPYFVRILAPLIVNASVAVAEKEDEALVRALSSREQVFQRLAEFAPILRAKSVVAHYRGTLTVSGKRTAWLVSKSNGDEHALELDFTKLFLALFKRSHTFNETFLQRFKDAQRTGESVAVPRVIEVVVNAKSSVIEREGEDIRIYVGHALTEMLTANKALEKMILDARPLLADLDVDTVAARLRESCFVETRDTAVTMAKNALIRGTSMDKQFACDLVNLFGEQCPDRQSVGSLHGSTVIRRGLAALQACCMFRDVLGHRMWFFPVAPPPHHPDLPWCSLSVYPDDHEDAPPRGAIEAWKATADDAVGGLVSEIMHLLNMLEQPKPKGLIEVLGEDGARKVIEKIDRISKSRGLLTEDVMAAVLWVAAGLRGFNHEGKPVELSVVIGTKFHATEFLGSVFDLGEQPFELQKRAIRRLIATLKGNFALFEGERRAAFLEYRDEGVSLCRVVELLDDLTRVTEIAGSRTAHLQALTAQSPDLIAITVTNERQPTARVFYGGELLLLQNEQGWQMLEPRFDDAWRMVEAFASDVDPSYLAIVRRLLQRLATTEGVGATVVLGCDIPITVFAAAMTASLANVDGNKLLEPPHEDFLFRLARMDGALVIDLATAVVYPRRYITPIRDGVPAIPERVKVEQAEDVLYDQWDDEHRALWYEWGTRHQTALLLSAIEAKVIVFVKSTSGSIALFRGGMNLLADSDPPPPRPEPSTA